VTHSRKEIWKGNEALYREKEKGWHEASRLLEAA